MKSELWQFKQYNRDTSKAHVLLHILSLHELKILKENCSRKGCIYLAEKQTESLLCSAGSAFPQYFVSTWVKPRAQIVIAWSDACTQMFFPACSTLGSQYEVRSSTGDLLWWCTLNGRNGSPLCANLQSHLGKMTGGKLISKSCLKLLILSFYLLLFLNLTGWFRFNFSWSVSIPTTIMYKYGLCKSIQRPIFLTWNPRITSLSENHWRKNKKTTNLITNIKW